MKMYQKLICGRLCSHYNYIIGIFEIYLILVSYPVPVVFGI